MSFKTTRRNLIETSLKGGVGLAVLSQLPALKLLASKVSGVGRPQNLKILTYFAGSHPLLEGLYTEFSQAIREMTKGEVNLTFVNVEALGPEAYAAKNPLSHSGFDGFYLSTAFAKEVLPGANLFSEVTPLNQKNGNSHLIDPAFVAAWNAVLSEQGLRWFPFGVGLKSGLWSKSPIESMDQLIKTPMMVTGSADLALNALGGQTTEKRYRRLEDFNRSELQATEGFMPYMDIKFGFQNIARFYYLGDWPRRNSQVGLIIKEHSLAKISTPARNVLEQSANQFNSMSTRKARALNYLALESIRAQGVTVAELPTDLNMALSQLKTNTLLKELSMDPRTSVLAELVNARVKLG